jgi:hypothetical protein
MINDLPAIALTRIKHCLATLNSFCAYLAVVRNLKFPKGLVFGPMNQDGVLFAVLDSNQHRKLMAGEIGAGVGENFNDLPVTCQ